MKMANKQMEIKSKERKLTAVVALLQLNTTDQFS